jgi:uncharacterized OB-fold protein
VTPEQEQQLHDFAALPREQADVWLTQRQEENRQVALAECAVGGHVFEAGAAACPRCATRYFDLPE